MFKRLYEWTLTLAESPRAIWALGAIAFAESSFFPLPPDLILVPMSLAKPRRAWLYAAVCTIASVVGGVLGYMIGSVLYDSVGKPLIHLYGYDEKAQALRSCYDSYGWLIILVKGLTPIPYKLVTIISGFAGYNIALFVALSLLTRGARFFILAGILNRFGEPIRAALDRHFATFMALILALIVFGFWVVSKMGGSGC
ncbi:MAG: DedA family protein [Hyphomicrobiales bacterium]|nr:DedA family protein [Hyphomicrobiales bacterium]